METKDKVLIAYVDAADTALLYSPESKCGGIHYI
jgi:hypothetical protein